MTNLTLRSVKGSPLTNTEVDNNFSNLDSDKLERTSTTGSAKLPVGTTAQRDGSPTDGMIRYNSTLNTFEGYSAAGGGWGEIGGGGDTYSVKAAQSGGNNDNPFILLDAAEGTDTQLLLIGGTNVTITRDSDGQITFSSVDTTYTGGDGLTLTGTDFDVDLTDTLIFTSTNTANRAVVRDGSGNFSAGTITASLSGNATSADSADNATAAITATKWLTSRTNTVTLTGDVTGSGNTSVDGSGNWTVSVATTQSPASASIGTSPPGSPISGTLWWNDSDGTMYIYYVDSDTSQWVEADANASIPDSASTQLLAIGLDYNVLSNKPTIGNGTLTLATSGTGLSGSTTFTANQTGAGTFTVTSNATDANTVGAIVARDGSGNFSAGTITASLSGNATSASSVTNAATFNNGGAGDASGTTFDGSVARTISYNTVGASPLAGSTSLVTTGTVTTGTWSGSFGAVSGANLTSLTAANISSGNLGSGVLPYATIDAAAAAYKVPFLNTTGIASGNFGLLHDTGATFTYNPSTNTVTAGTFSGALSGNATTATTASGVAANSVALGTDTTGNYIATISGTTNEIEVTGSGSETAAVTIGLPNDVTIGNNLTVTGNLTVNGTTTTVNSTTITVDDPVFTLGGDTAPGADDNKDRGIEFRWHNGTVAKVGFFGFDDSTSKFIFIPDATNTSEVFSGTKGTIDANIEWTDILNKPTYDNYSSWSFTASDTQAISSGETVTFSGSGATTVTNTGNTITISSTDTNTTNFNVQANGGTQVNISAGEEVNFIDGSATTAVVVNQTNPTVTFNHNDTSTQASLTALTGANVVSDIDLDDYGHVTLLATRALTAGDIGAATSGHNHTLDSLSNVTITANSSGEILKWSGTAWINNTLAEAGIQPAGSYLTGNQTITLSGDVTGSGTTAITCALAANTVTSTELSGAVSLIIYNSAGTAVKTLYGSGS